MKALLDLANSENISSDLLSHECALHNVNVEWCLFRL
jgi:hypothetical protein